MWAGDREDNAAALVNNGDRDNKEAAWHKELLGKAEATASRGLAARLKYMNQDCPDLQFVFEDVSRDMANPNKG